MTFFADRSAKKNDHLSRVQIIIQYPRVKLLISPPRVTHIFLRDHTPDHKVRVVGLSTALANARDLADWLAIKNVGLYNFRPSVRPVPLEVHIKGFPGKHYCPRMASMNKPTFQVSSFNF